MGGCGNAEGRVARVDVMTNRDEEVGARLLAARSDLKWTASQARSLFKHPPDVGVVTGGDRREDRKQHTLIEVVGYPT